MTNTPSHLNFESASTLIDSLANVTRQSIGCMEYVTGTLGEEAVSLCVDLFTGEAIRVH